MLYNTKALLLHCVFHGIRFKVNEDWVSVIDTLLFFYESCGLRVAFFMLPHPEEIRDMQLLHIPLFLCSCLLSACQGYSFCRYMGEGLHSAFQAELPQFCIGDVFLFGLVVYGQ